MSDIELFLYELNGHGYDFENKTFLNCRFEDDQLNMVYEMWQASASRQGYKLVPIEPTQEMLDKFPEVVYQDTYAGECSLLVDDETLRSGYKAMIGEYTK